MTIRVPIAVDYDPKRLKAAQADLEGLGRGGGKMGAALKMGALGAAGAVAGLGVVLASSVKAAQESQKVTAQLRTRLDKLGLSYKANAQQIDATIAAQSRLSAFDDEDLTKSFTDLVANTKNVDTALKASAAAADLARARNISLESATKIVSGALEGSTGKLKKLGVELQKGASDTEVLAAIQSKYAGSAEAYGKTSAGAQEKFQNAIENLKESIGAGLLPILTKLTEWGVQALEWAQASWPAWKDAIIAAFDEVVKFINAYLLPIWEAIKPVVMGAVQFTIRALGRLWENVKAIVQLVKGIIHGDFGKVWGAVKTIVGNAISSAIDFLKSVSIPALKLVGSLLGKAIVAGLKLAVSGIVAIVKVPINLVIGLINAVTSKINSLLEVRTPAVKFLGKTIIPSIHFNPPDIPPIPALAAGGIVTRPTLAMIGEAGPEAVVPLNRSSAAGAVGATYNITVNAGIGTDGAQVGREIVRALQAFTRANGSLAGWVS